MARRTGLLFLIVICVIGLGWLLGGEESGPTSLDPASDPAGAEASPAPSLTTVAPPRAPEDNRARRIPDWAARKDVLYDAAQRKRLIAWVRADPWHAVDWLRHLVAVSAKRDDNALFYELLRQFSLFSGMAKELLPVLEAHLQREPISGRERVAVLGAMSALGVGRRGYEQATKIVSSGDEPLSLRVLVARMLIPQKKKTPQEIEALAAFLRELADPPRHEIHMLLYPLLHMGEQARPFVPTLLAIRGRLQWFSGGDEMILKIVARADPGNPGARELFLNGLGHPHPDVRASALLALSKGDDRAIEELARALESAPAAARVQGARLLQQRGVARDRIPGLLLSGLAQGDWRVREQAIILLARAAVDPHEALPVIRELLASKDKGRWISGTKALGSLTTGSGARDDIMQMLFTAARLPDSKVRILAVQSLLMYDDHAKAVIPVLADLLQDTEVEVRREAVDGLGEMSARDEGARAHLQAALGDSDESVRKLAKYWLRLEDDEDR